jgi:hypothetical protein
MATTATSSALSIDERLRNQPPRTKLVYLLLRDQGPLQRSTLTERTYVSESTVGRAPDELEETLGDEFTRRPDRNDLRRVICDVEAKEEV